MRDCHAEVAQEDCNFIEVGMLIAHMYEFREFDLLAEIDALFGLPLSERFAGFRDCFDLWDGRAAIWGGFTANVLLNV
jgi:hypothetical protein